jgi:DNA-binding NtrC family response regulator
VTEEHRETGTIVVIDDDEAARQSIGQMLGLCGWAVEVFSSAEAALSWPGLNDAVCIVTDVKMPGMDGEEFLARVNAREGSPPVVMLTGHGDIAMAVRCLKAGAFDFAEKPFDDAVLLAYVSKAAEKTRLVREAQDLRHRLTLCFPAEDARFGMVGRNAVERLVITSRNGTAGSFTPDLPDEDVRLLSLPAGTGRLREEMEKVEKAVIEAALRECRGEINATWQVLGISRRALYERMRRYGLDKGSFR